MNGGTIDCGTVDESDIFADFLTVNGGVIEVGTLHAYFDAAINGGEIELSSSLSAQNQLTINGGKIDIDKNESGVSIDTPVFEFNGGNLHASGIVLSNGEGSSITLDWKDAVDSFYAEQYCDLGSGSSGSDYVAKTVNLRNDFEDVAGVSYSAGAYGNGELDGKTLYPHSHSWSELQAMIDNAAFGDTITLQQSYKAADTDSALIIPDNMDITIDLNGFTIDRGLSNKEAVAGGNVITLLSCNLTIKDSSKAKNGKITGGNNTENGGGIILNSSDFVLESGTITGNKTTGDGGGVWGKGWVTVVNGTITGNEAGGNGGGVCFNGDINNNKLKLSGSPLITGNTGAGGSEKDIALVIPSGKDITLDLNGHTLSRGRTEWSYDGNVLTVNGTLTITDTDGEGGGISEYERRVDALNIQGSPVVTDNTADTRGNNIRLLDNYVLTVTGTLSDSARIGVTSDLAYRGAVPPFVITDGLSGKGSAANFVSDLDNYIVVQLSGDDDGEAALVEKPTVTVNGVSGSFQDKIKLNYYFDIPETLRTDQEAYVTLTNESTGKSVTLPVNGAEYVDEKGYKFSIPLAAKEAGDTISARVFDGQGSAVTIRGNLRDNDYTETGVLYTLMQYFTWLENNGTDKNEKAVGAAAKDYCAAVQLYFNYNADNVSVSSDVDAVTAEMLSSYIADREGTLPTGASIRGITAMLESDNTLRLYLGFKNADPDSFTYTIDGNEANLHQRSDGAYFLALNDGVYSNHLQDTHTYTVSDGANAYTITASVLTYARACAIKSNENDSRLGKALYLYSRAASEAFNQ